MLVFAIFCQAEAAGGSQDHLVCLHLLTILKDQSHRSKVLLTLGTKMHISREFPGIHRKIPFPFSGTGMQMENSIPNFGNGNESGKFHSRLSGKGILRKFPEIPGILGKFPGKFHAL